MAVTVSEDEIIERAYQHSDSRSQEDSLPLSNEDSLEEVAPLQSTFAEHGQKKLGVAFKKLMNMGDKMVLKLASGIDKVIDKIDGIEKPQPIRPELCSINLSPEAC